MKYILSLALLVSFAVNAQSLRSLEDVMKDMGKSFKTISTAVSAKAITPATVTEAQKLVSLIVESESITPDTVLSLPNVEQEAAKTKYVQELKTLEKSANELVEALKANNVDLATQKINELNVQKKQGHTDYKN